MLPEFLQNVSLFHTLYHIDLNLAQECQQAGCPFCQGPLHRAPYLRKPRGGPLNIPEEFQVRQSLCCGREGCRRRVLPPSCLFQGRKVYWRAVILVVVSLRQGRFGGFCINKLARMFSIDRKTVVRWIRYFQDELAISAQWQRLRGLIDIQVTSQDLPGSLLAYFFQYQTSSAGGLINCLRFLAGGHVY